MNDAAESGYEEVDHTADWSLRVWAPDLAGLLEQAARGMYHLLGVQQADEPLAGRKLALQAPDTETLLVDFLNEILYFAEEERLAFRHFYLSLDGHELEAELEGTAIEAQTKEIKAVTYHRLNIEEGKKGLSTELVFDV